MRKGTYGLPVGREDGFDILVEGFLLLLVQSQKNERVSECMRCRLVARDEEQEDVPWRMIALQHNQREGRTDERTDERAVGKLRGAI